MKIGVIPGFDRKRHRDRNRYRDSAFELLISDCDTDAETAEFYFA
jgi:hypothetical protein